VTEERGQKTDDRVLNSEIGMRNSERKTEDGHGKRRTEGFDFGMGNAGMRRERQRAWGREHRDRRKIPEQEREWGNRNGEGGRRNGECGRKQRYAEG